MTRKWIRPGLIACGMLILTPAPAQTLTVIKNNRPVATLEIAAGMPVEISGERSMLDESGKATYYSGHVEARIRGDGKPWYCGPRKWSCVTDAGIAIRGWLAT